MSKKQASTKTGKTSRKEDKMPSKRSGVRHLAGSYKRGTITHLVMTMFEEADRKGKDLPSVERVAKRVKKLNPKARFNANPKRHYAYFRFHYLHRSDKKS